MGNNRLSDLVKILGPILRKNRDGYLVSAKEQIEIVGIDATDQELYLAADIILSSSDIASALTALGSVNDADIEARAAREQARLEACKQKVKSEEKAAEDLQASAAAAAKEAKRVAEERAAERVLLANAIADAISSKFLPKVVKTEFQDYTVVQRTGMHEWVLRAPVAKAMSQGWVPVGGVDVLFNTNMNEALYSQAMALPADKPKSSLAARDTF
jgi:hypothetical protein